MDSQTQGNLEDRLVRFPGTIREVYSALQSNGYDIMPTAAEIAEVVSDCAFPCSGMSTIVAETVNYFPGEPYILIASRKLNPVFQYLNGRSIGLWRKLPRLFKDNDFYLSGEQQRDLLKIADEDKQKPPRERRVFRWDKVGYLWMRREAICDNRTPESKLARFLYKGAAREFSSFLRENGVERIPFWLDNEKQIDSHRAPYTRLLEFIVRSTPSNAHLLIGDMVYADSIGTYAIKPSS